MTVCCNSMVASSRAACAARRRACRAWRASLRAPGAEQLQTLAGAVVHGARLMQAAGGVLKLLGGLQTALDHTARAFGEPLGVSQFSAAVLDRIDRLGDFLRQRAGLHLRPLRLQRVNLCGGPGHPRLKLGIGNAGDHLAGANQIPLHDAQFLKMPGGFWKHLDARLRQDVARGREGLGKRAASGDDGLDGKRLDGRWLLGGGGTVGRRNGRQIGVGENDGSNNKHDRQGGSHPTAHYSVPMGQDSPENFP